MSYVVNNLPRGLQAKARQLCADLRSQALAGAFSWTVDSTECFEQHGFTWAASRNHCSVDVYIDEHKGKVHRVVIELPDRCALNGPMFKDVGVNA